MEEGKSSCLNHTTGKQKSVACRETFPNGQNLPVPPTISGPAILQVPSSNMPGKQRIRLSKGYFFNLVEIGKNWIIFNKNICFFATCVLYYLRDILRIDQ